WIPGMCEAQGLGWVHLPLSGRRMDQPGDRESLAQLPTRLGIWDQPRRVVVHCSAGLHRTGAICYLLLRLAGMARDARVPPRRDGAPRARHAAGAHIRVARQLTAEELVRGARSGVLIDHMDALLAGGLR